MVPVLLPKVWFDYLTQGTKLDSSRQVKDNKSTLNEIVAWATETLPGFKEDLCPRMREKVDKHKQLTKEEATSYDKLTNAHMNVVHLAVEGHIGCDKALEEISKIYKAVCIERAKRDDEEQIDKEIFRSVTGALRKDKQEIKDGIRPLLPRCDGVGGLCNTNGQVVAGADPHTFSNDRRLGQLRISHMFAEKFGGKLIHVKNVGWHYWDGKRWAEDDRGKAYRAAIKILEIAWNAALTLPKDEKKRLTTAVNSCQSHSGITGILAIATNLKEFATTVNDLDQDPYLLNVANGTLNLRNMDLQAHDPADKITKICRAAYRPEAVSDVWNSFLEKVLPDEAVRSYVQRLVGISLSGKVEEHLLPILIGEGRNGKSTFYEALLHALGDYGKVAEPDLFMHKAEGAHTTGMVDLLGARLVVVSESDKNRRLAEATMRRLTGGDPITARRMHKDNVTFIPSHLAMLITNHLPKVSGDNPATWARMRVIPFDVVIPSEERDTHMGDKLQDEADAVLTWSLQGWEQYGSVGTAEPQAVLTATDKYQEDSDDVATFIEEECVIGEEAVDRQSTTRELHQAWLRWQMKSGCPPMGQKEFSKALDAKGYPMVGRRHERHGLGLGPAERSFRVVQ